jgi:hypothetical protein
MNVMGQKDVFAVMVAPTQKFANTLYLCTSRSHRLHDYSRVPLSRPACPVMRDVHVQLL